MTFFTSLMLYPICLFRAQQPQEALKKLWQHYRSIWLLNFYKVVSQFYLIMLWVSVYFRAQNISPGYYIIFQQYYSQEILIRRRILINFEKGRDRKFLEYFLWICFNNARFSTKERGRGDNCKSFVWVFDLFGQYWFKNSLSK